MAGSGRDRTSAQPKKRAPRTDTRTTAAGESNAPRSARAPKASLELAKAIAATALEGKAADLVVLDLTGVTDMTDYFVIASGTSDTHVRSIGQRIVEQMKKAGFPAHHVEGLEQGRWVLLDFVDVVVHLFHPTLRTFYQLERLWGDAEPVPIAGAAGDGK